MVSVVGSSMINHGFDTRHCNTKEYIIDFCCLYAIHTIFTSKNNEWLSPSHDTSRSLWTVVSVN